MNNDYWQNIEDIALRQRIKGKQKYGMTIEDNQEPSFDHRMTQIEEELVDALEYIEWAKDEHRKDDGNTAKWIADGGLYYCERCGWPKIFTTNYCPNCGAEMMM